MSILGIYENEIDKTLISYTLSLFENCHTEITSNINTTNKSSLVVVTAKCLSKIDTNFIKKTPIFLLSTSLLSVEALSFSNIKIWDSYHSPNFKQYFDFESNQITDTELRLSLIRKVNYILYNKLKMKLNSSSCGIERDDIECGDESDY